MVFDETYFSELDDTLRFVEETEISRDSNKHRASFEFGVFDIRASREITGGKRIMGIMFSP